MVHFAKRLARPPVQEVTDSKDIEMLKQTNKNFFMFIGNSVGHTWVLHSYKVKVKYYLICYYFSRIYFMIWQNIIKHILTFILLLKKLENR